MGCSLIGMSTLIIKTWSPVIAVIFVAVPAGAEDVISVVRIPLVEPRKNVSVLDNSDIEPVASTTMSKSEFVEYVLEKGKAFPLLGLLSEIRRATRGENFKLEFDFDPFKTKYGIGVTIKFPMQSKIKE